MIEEAPDAIGIIPGVVVHVIDTCNPVGSGVCPTYSLLQIHPLRHGHQELNRRTWTTSHGLLPDGDRVIICRQQYFGFFTLLEHMELAMSLEGKARRLLQDAPSRDAEPDRP